MSISGKVALVTGGASGIGLAVVKTLLQNGARGVSIVDVSANNGAKALEDLGGAPVIFIQADVSNKEDIVKSFDKTVETFKNLNIVVNNAGFVDEVDWQRSLDVMLKATIQGTYLAMMEYFPKYKSGHEGLIVNTASIFGINNSYLVPIYSVCKRGVIALGQNLGTDHYYSQYRTRILTVCPGFTTTPLGDFSNGEIKLLLPHFKLNDLFEIGGAERWQTAEFVAQKYVEIIEKGANGSVWVVEDEKPEYQVDLPNRKNLKL